MFEAFRLISSRPISNVVDEGFSLTESQAVGRIWQEFHQISSLLVGFFASSPYSVRLVGTVFGPLDRCGVDSKGEIYFKTPVRSFLSAGGLCRFRETSTCRQRLGRLLNLSIF